MKIKTAELVGLPLDWAVAQVQLKCGDITDDREEIDTGRPFISSFEGRSPYIFGPGERMAGLRNRHTGKPLIQHGTGQRYSPSTDWDQGGPLIEAFDIELRKFNDGWCAGQGTADLSKPKYYGSVPVGPIRSGVFGSYPDRWDSKPLVAAMRAVVGVVLGDEVEVPDELLEAA